MRMAERIALARHFRLRGNDGRNLHLRRVR
jgi:hypothetical protein